MDDGRGGEGIWEMVEKWEDLWIGRRDRGGRKGDLNLENSIFNLHTSRFSNSQVEYEVVFLYYALGLTLAVKKDSQASMGIGSESPYN